MIAPQLDIALPADGDWAHVATIKYPDGSARDLSGDDVTVTVEDCGTGAQVADVTAAVIHASAGKVELRMPRTEIANLPTRAHRYRIRLTSPGRAPETVLTGTLTRPSA